MEKKMDKNSSTSVEFFLAKVWFSCHFMCQELLDVFNKNVQGLDHPSCNYQIIKKRSRLNVHTKWVNREILNKKKKKKVIKGEADMCLLE